MPFHTDHKNIEDWTPPWGDDFSNADEDKLKRLIFQLRTSESELGEKVSDRDKALETYREAERKAKLEAESDEERRKREKSESEAESQKLAAENLRLRVQIKTGLTDAQMRRVVGDDYDSMLKDAEEYKAEISGQEPEGEPGEEPEGEPEGEPSEEQPGTPLRQPRPRRLGLREEPEDDPDEIARYFEQQDKSAI